MRFDAGALRGARAVLFDVDGTLYRQQPLRALMLAEIAGALALVLLGGKAPPVRGLAAYRRAQEELREVGARGRIRERQMEAAAARSGMSPEDLSLAVQEWMVRRPLRYLRVCRRGGLGALLDCLDQRGIKAGVLSDYPATEKIHALGLTGRFSLELCTMDSEIDALKPDPKGFLLACARWNLAPGDVAYVGDRPEVDASGAEAAGMRAVVVGPRWRGRVSLRQLHAEVERHA